MKVWRFSHRTGLDQFRDDMRAFVDDIRAMSKDDVARLKSNVEACGDLVILLPDPLVSPTEGSGITHPTCCM